MKTSSKLMTAIAGIMSMFGTSLPAISAVPAESIAHVGSGWYGMKTTVSAGGVTYTKLVKRDKSAVLQKDTRQKIGQRYTHKGLTLS